MQVLSKMKLKKNVVSAFVLLKKCELVESQVEMQADESALLSTRGQPDVVFQAATPHEGFCADVVFAVGGGELGVVLEQHRGVG